MQILDPAFQARQSRKSSDGSLPTRPSPAHIADVNAVPAPGEVVHDPHSEGEGQDRQGCVSAGLS